MTSDLFAPWPDPRNYEELAEAVKEEPQYCVAAVWQRQFLRHLIDSCSNELGATFSKLPKFSFLRSS